MAYAPFSRPSSLLRDVRGFLSVWDEQLQASGGRRESKIQTPKRVSTHITPAHVRRGSLLHCHDLSDPRISFITLQVPYYKWLTGAWARRLSLISIPRSPTAMLPFYETQLILFVAVCAVSLLADRYLSKPKGPPGEEHASRGSSHSRALLTRQYLVVYGLVMGVDRGSVCAWTEC